MFGEFFSLVKDLTNEASTSGKKLEVNFDTLTMAYANAVNDKILNEEFYKIAHYLGGNFTFEYVDEKNYTCAYKLYFQDTKNETYELNAKSGNLDSTRLSDDAQKELADKKIIKFDIPEPDENVRKKYKLVKQ